MRWIEQGLILHDTHLAWLQWIDFKNSTESRILNEFSLSRSPDEKYENVFTVKQMVKMSVSQSFNL